MTIISGFWWKRGVKARLLLAIFGVLLIFTSVMVILFRTPSTPTSEILPTFPKRPEEIAAAKDSDNDGLKDWEEPLYGTDSANPDTDGDGTNDEDEVRAGRDPIKAGPDDLLFVREEAAPANTAKPDNLTRTLGETAIREYFNKRTSAGGSFGSKEFAQDVIQQFLSSGNTTISFPTVRSEQIIIARDDSPETKKQYLNQLATITAKTTTGIQDPLMLLTSILQSQDTKTFDAKALTPQLVRFDLVIRRYEAFLADTEKLPVPRSWKGYHEQTLNLILKLITIIKGFRDTDKDMVRGIVMVKYYQEAMGDAQKILQEIDRELKAAHIVFDQEEPAKKIFKL